MPKILVIVTCEDNKLKSISVDGGDLDDISYIRNKPIEEWFEKASKKSSWKGLIPEIKEILTDTHASLVFKFNGSMEQASIFDDYIRKFGYEVWQSGNAENKDMAEDFIDKAEEDIYRGDLDGAFEDIKKAADDLGSPEAQYKLAEEYYKCYKGEDTIINEKKEDTILHAVEYYKRAAEVDYKESSYKLYKIYYDGDGVDKDIDEAIRWLTKAVKSEDADIQYELGNIYYSDKNDEIEAFKWYEKSAEQGNANAQYEVGRFYDLGKTVEENPTLAFEWYKKSAEQGNVEAQYKLGFCYMSGYGTTVNYDKSYNYYSMAAKQGNAKAQYGLYKLIISGKKKTCNGEREAVEWLSKAVDSGNVEYQIELGDCYRYGRGNLRKDKEKAIEWYEKASVKETIDIYKKIADTYMELSEDTNDKDHVSGRALYWLHKASERGSGEAKYKIGKYFEKAGKKYDTYKMYLDAADIGYREAQFELGKCYEYGNGVPKDNENAFKWYMKAAEQGHAEAQYKVGQYYENGKGTEKNAAKAVDWYFKSANQDYTDAQYKLGLCYQYGAGITKNYDRAFSYYLKVADKGGHAEAENMVGYFYENGLGVEKNINKAFSYYLRAAERGYAVAQCNTGWCYDFGKGVTKDYAKAIEWYNKAIEQNNTRAMYLKGLCYEYGTGVAKNLDTAFQWYKKGADSIENPNADCCYKIAEAYYAQMDSGLKAAGRTGVMLAISVLIPVTNIFTIPAALAGSGVSYIRKRTKFLKTDAGKDMMKYYRKAANLGHEDAKKKVTELEAYL